MPQKLVLLVARFSNPLKDLAAVTLGWMCKERGIAFDALYAAPRSDGGIFSPHGSAVIGGRQALLVARALSQFETTVVKLDDSVLFDSYFRGGAVKILSFPGSLVALYRQFAAEIGLSLPTCAVAFQGGDLPAGLRYGMVKPVFAPDGHKLVDDRALEQHNIVPYAYLEAASRRALAVPLEASPAEIDALKDACVNQAWKVATAQADDSTWQQAGFAPQFAEAILSSDTLASFSFHMAEKWMDQAQAVDLYEPLLASHWLPFMLREQRLGVCSADMKEAADRLTPLALRKGQSVVYGRYAGGALRGAINDSDLFSMFRAGIAFEVTEPGRPSLTIFSHDPQPIPQPVQSPFDAAPSDEQLKNWAREGKILVALLTHSGELSHNDAIVNMLDLSATTGIKAGIGVHLARYTFDPESIEMMQTPVEEGGVLGVCEPVLHSAGYGMLTESIAEPERAADLMRRSRDEIARLAGERFAPRGVYCFSDAVPNRWDEQPGRLWAAVKQAGFSYLVSSVSFGEPRVLYADHEFIVLNQCGSLHYPYSPFVRIDTAADIAAWEEKLTAKGKPSWLVPVLDIPIYAYSNYLSLGDPFKHRGGLGQFYAFLLKGGNSGKLVSATPHTVARYARLIMNDE
jgi:hypothetical protein